MKSSFMNTYTNKTWFNCLSFSFSFLIKETNIWTSTNLRRKNLFYKFYSSKIFITFFEKFMFDMVFNINSFSEL